LSRRPPEALSRRARSCVQRAWPMEGLPTVKRCMLISKIHMATVTAARVDYMGSLTIPRGVMEAAGILPFEQILVANTRNGERFTTYAIAGEDAGEFCLNGAAARLGSPGDRIIVLAFAWIEEAEARSHTPTVVHMGEGNRIDRVSRDGPPGGEETRP
jgi:aspartate 1-decarboxylase